VLAEYLAGAGGGGGLAGAHEHDAHQLLLAIVGVELLIRKVDDDAGDELNHRLEPPTQEMANP
jgi:hypothetical protein